MERMGKADTHVHTDYSGFNSLGLMSFPESVIDPAKQVDDARRRGLDVLCITDHNEVAGSWHRNTPRSSMTSTWWSATRS